MKQINYEMLLTKYTDVGFEKLIKIIASGIARRGAFEALVPHCYRSLKKIPYISANYLQ